MRILKYILVFFLIAVIFLIPALAFIDRLFWFFNPKDTTNFARGYTELGFWQIQKGTTADEVIQKIGCPLVVYTSCESKKGGKIFDSSCAYSSLLKYCISFPEIVCKEIDNEHLWVYSVSVSDGDFLVRDIQFDGCVLNQKHRTYYFD